MIDTSDASLNTGARMVVWVESVFYKNYKFHLSDFWIEIHCGKGLIIKQRFTSTIVLFLQAGIVQFFI
jgi:hypothetical protein